MSSFFKETHHISDCSITEYCSWIIIFHWRHQVVNNICSKTEVSIVCIMTIFLESNSFAIVSITKVSQYNKSHLVSIKPAL